MQKNNLLTFFRSRSLVLLLLSFIVLLSGCAVDTPVDSSSTGFFTHYFVYPFSLLIKKVAHLLFNNYSLAIIMITLLIRFMLLPFFIKQTRATKESQAKMTVIKPEMDEIQAKYKGKTSREDQINMQQELAEVYKKHNFNPLQMVTGCLPLFLQMPILIAFYYAIRRTPEISEQSFLWFQLGETDLIFVFLAVLIYFIQSRVSLIGLEAQQKQQMKLMGIISPVMIGLISLSVPAALPLYWAVSGLFMIGQTLILKRDDIKA